jgi:predicted DNA-binding protein
MKKKNRTIPIDDNQYSALRKLSEQTGAPIAELIRRGIDLVIKKMSK